MTIRAYVVRRLALAIFVLLGIASITFVMARIVPSNVAQTYVGANARPEQIAQATKILGLDKPLYEQYAIYMKGLVTGDWGDSLRTKRPVLNDIIHFFPATLELVVAALIVATFFGIILGVTTAHMRGGWLDHFHAPVLDGGSLDRVLLAGADAADPVLPHAPLTPGGRPDQHRRRPGPPHHRRSPGCRSWTR